MLKDKERSNAESSVAVNETVTNPLDWLEKYGDLLYRIALIRVAKPHLAEDLVQETLLAAWQARESFKGKSKEETWLVAILKRKIIDHFRQSWRQVDIPEEIDIGDLAADFKESGNSTGHWKAERAPGNWGQDPEMALQNSQLGSILLDCINKLPESLSTIFVVREIEGMSTENICNEFSLTPSNLWVILYRARTKLRRCVEKSWYQSD